MLGLEGYTKGNMMVMQSDSKGASVYVRCIVGISFDRRGGVVDVVEEELLRRFDSRFFCA